MDFSLTAVEKRFLDKAKQLADEFATRARENDENATFPKENFARLKEEGFLKLTVPEEYGGHGLWSDDNYLGFYLILETIAAGCSATGQLLQVHSHCTSNVAVLANKQQKDRILPDVAERGALVGSAGDSGRVIAEGKAMLRPVDGGFRLSMGTSFGSLSGVCDYLLAFAAAPGAKSFGESVALCLPRGQPGITITDSWADAMGMRGTVSWSVKYDDAFIPWDCVLGHPGDFIRDPRGWTLAYTANYLGTAQGAFNNVIKYLKSKPDLLDDDTVCMMVYEMDSALQATRSSLWYTCWLWERKDYAAAELAALRVNNSAKKTALMVTTKAFDICGARSAFRDLPFERAWRDARMFSLHTRESRNARLHAKAVVTGDFHAKREYSASAERRRWEDYGVTPPPSHQ